MTFFEEHTNDVDELPGPGEIDPEELEIGISATELPNGEIEVELTLFVDGVVAPAPPTDDEVEAWHQWTNGVDAPSHGTGDIPADENGTNSHAHPIIDEVGYEREGWGVICHPDNTTEWIAMPYQCVIPDINDHA